MASLLGRRRRDSNLSTLALCCMLSYLIFNDYQIWENIIAGLTDRNLTDFLERNTGGLG